MLPPDPPSSIAAPVSRTKFENFATRTTVVVVAPVSRTKFENVATRPAVVDRNASVANEIRKFCYPNRRLRIFIFLSNVNLDFFVLRPLVRDNVNHEDGVEKK
ncbi:unnamed protein product [Macrosiphum euphorbiae]|uniref:Uncharacterized protein n=1 Tax=Macrosiphum euphorbiae TaxID=13131 RepID=A0AAV0XNU2_9HEMI|nr:unnamed protein product [Macrosiphum euphorbiae]